MKIQNIRYGFATNSSSSHSIIYVNDASKIPSDSHGESFGWDHFTLTDPLLKAAYLGHNIRRQLTKLHNLSMEDAIILASSYINASIDPEGYVDHQSDINFPISKIPYLNNFSINRSFLSKVRETLLNPNIVIIGGNDNDDSEHPLQSFAKESDLLKIFNVLGGEGGELTTRCLEDQDNKFWSIMNVYNGTKLRIPFEDNIQITKGSVPELIDVKITNKCKFGCKYCYQDSIPEGKHASLESIKSFINSIKHHDVFEVALGGGEPTEHPDFIEILKLFKNANIIVNFTTKDIDNLEKNIEEYTKYVSAIGVSISDPDSIKRLNFKMYPCPKIVAHIIPSILSENVFHDMMEECKKNFVPILLLGYKTNGRGDSYKNKLKTGIDIVEYIKKNEGYKISFDTCLVKEYEKTLPEISDKIYWASEEGAFSMYVDLVESTAGISSYHTQYKFNSNYIIIKDLFNFVQGKEYII